MRPQITVLDAGGQYCHLIARKVRDLGVYADVKASETPASDLQSRKGLIISGGPSSVYDPDSPTVDPAIFRSEPAVLGICYGQQLMAHLLDGSVRKGDRGEYGLAFLDIDVRQPILEGISGRQQVWMSHRDVVERTPSGFTALARTETCPIAAMGDPSRRLYSVQFHPEVVQTQCGKAILANFVFRICGCEKDWSPRQRIDDIEDQIRRATGARRVFFFVSGGVDSTVAYTLCVRALGAERVRGAYVDTGLMREGETDYVRGVFQSLGKDGFSVQDVQPEFLTQLATASDPEQKRLIIGEQFVAVQERVLESGHYLNGDWILGQGTIYPDTIESGGTAKADKIKTHHNRVNGIQRLIEAGRIIEPLSEFYKDEVREIGRELGLPADLLDRHPFPGPGLAIRCLCAADSSPVIGFDEGWLLPIRSVGVQGDERTYRSALALDLPPAEAIGRAPELINRLMEVNRVVSSVGSHAPMAELRSTASTLSVERLARLRCADAIVRRLSVDSGFDRTIWQFPVVLIPVGHGGRPDSVVLRPIDSVDGMTANAVVMDSELLTKMTEALLAIDGVCAVFYDLTNKPPATIEWE